MNVRRYLASAMMKVSEMTAKAALHLTREESSETPLRSTVFSYDSKLTPEELEELFEGVMTKEAAAMIVPVQPTPAPEPEVEPLKGSVAARVAKISGTL